MPAEPVIISQPKHALHALTTYELRDYRQDLERAIKGISPDAPVRAALRGKLDEVLALIIHPG
jgi:hypothetical protein